MASSAHKQQQIPNPYGATAAPPPTPSTEPNHLSTSDAADALSRLLHRLPPTLSLPTRLSAPTTCPTLTSLSDENPKPLKDILSQVGFFQLANHPIPPQLARSAESDSLSLFDLPEYQKHQYFPKNWPLGFDGDDEEDRDGRDESFCLDSSCSVESTELSLTSLGEFTRAMEKLGMEVIELLSCAVGFENPFRNDPSLACSLMWISEGSPGIKPGICGRLYPYIIGLQYQIRLQKYSLLADSGWVSVSPQVDSVIITLGDIAQVWSNGKLKKVRGRPMASAGDGNGSRCTVMSLLVTLPLDSTVCPLPLIREVINGGEDDEANNNNGGQIDNIAAGEREKQLFNSFCFEDYAWRLYHERLLFKDALERYRI